MKPTYRLLDCGDKRKLEQFGPYTIIRPCPQAIWKPALTKEWTTGIDAEFKRTGEERGVWHWNEKKYTYTPAKKPILKSKIGAKNKKGQSKSDSFFSQSYISAGNNTHAKPVPLSWSVKNTHNLDWVLEPNIFGNIGVFVEHWEYVESIHKQLQPKSTILNLFTYSGSNCVYLAQKGHKITAVDSSKNAMNAYTQNLENNGISRDGQRLILEDCNRFLSREVRRERMYDCIMIDAPSFGRGTKGEVFKIEDNFTALLEDAKKVIMPQGLIVCTLHSPRFTPKILELLASTIFENAQSVSCEEIIVPCKSGRSIPSGFILTIRVA